MPDIYVDSAAGAIQYTNQAWATGNKMVPGIADASANVNLARSFVWECTVAGTSTTSPTWPATVAQDTEYNLSTGGTERFTARIPGYSSGTTKNVAFATPLINCGCLAHNQHSTATDKIFVSSSHVESIGGTVEFPGTATTNITTPLQILSVSDLSSNPPTTLSQGATVRITGNSPIRWAETGVYFYGLCFAPGYSSAGSAAYTYLGYNGQSGPYIQTLENCKFIGANYNSNAFVDLGFTQNSANEGSHFILNDCDFDFGHSAKRVKPYGAITEFNNFKIVGTTVPVSLFVMNNASNGQTTVSNSDLSTHAWTNAVDYSNGLGMHVFKFVNCKMPSSWVGCINMGGPGQYTYFLNCTSSSGINYEYRRYSWEGTITLDTSTYLTSGGQTDGTTPHSLKIATTANCSWFNPCCSDWHEVWKSASETSLSVKVLYDSTTAATTADLWLEWEYAYTTNYSQGKTYSTGKTSVIASASNLTDTAEDSSWTTGVTNKMTHTLTTGNFTPSLAGYVRYRVCVGIASKTFYCNMRQS